MEKKIGAETVPSALLAFRRGDSGPDDDVSGGAKAWAVLVSGRDRFNAVNGGEGRGYEVGLRQLVFSLK